MLPLKHSPTRFVLHLVHTRVVSFAAPFGEHNRSREKKVQHEFTWLRLSCVRTLCQRALLIHQQLTDKTEANAFISDIIHVSFDVRTASNNSSAAAVRSYPKYTTYLHPVHHRRRHTHISKITQQSKKRTEKKQKSKRRPWKINSEL